MSKQLMNIKNLPYQKKMRQKHLLMIYKID